MGNIETDILGLMNWYHPLAARTINPIAPLRYYQIGFLSELGELCGLYKKQQWHDKKIPDSEWISELGDCLWYGVTYLSKLTLVWSEDHVARMRAWDVACKRTEHRYQWRIKDQSGGGSVENVTYIVWVGQHKLDDLKHTSMILGELLALCEQYGGVENVMKANIAKLKARFPGGFVPHAQRADHGGSEG